MRRRSFFGVVFGGIVSLLLRRPRRPRGARYVHDEWFVSEDPRYRFGFSGFKPEVAHRHADEADELPDWVRECTDRFHAGHGRVISQG